MIRSTLNGVMLKLMEGRPADLTPRECDYAVKCLAEWDLQRPKATGRPKQDHVDVALHYWALIEFRGALPKNAKSDVAAAWGLSQSRVAEIASRHELPARELVKANRNRPDAFLRVMEHHASVEPKRPRPPKK